MKKESLQTKLIFSHMIIALIGALFLLLSLSANYFLQKNLNQLMNEAIPSVEITRNIQTELESSVASLRGWINIKDVTLTKARQLAWIDGIDPNLQKLSNLSENKNDINTKLTIKLLKKYLADIKMWQWRIEDIAQTPGNMAVSNYMSKYVMPSEKRVMILFDGFIKESENENDFLKKNRLTEPRDLFSKSLSYLYQYIITNDLSLLEKSDQYQMEVKKKLISIQENGSTFSQKTLNDIDVLSKQLDIFSEIKSELIKIKFKEGNSKASYYLEKYAIPLSRTAQNLLNNLVKTELNKQGLSKTKTEKMVKNVLIGLMISILTLIILALILGKKYSLSFLKPISLLLNATQKAASGANVEEIKIEKNDEIGLLTESFNKMQQLRYRAEKLTHELIETALDPIITINSKGIIQSSNTATTKLFEYEPEELIDSNVSIIMPEPYHSEHDQYLKNYLETKNKKIIGISREVQGRSKSGVIIPLVLSVNEIIINNERLFAGILHDIREEKAKKEELESLNDKLILENKEKDTITQLENTLRGVNEVQVAAENTLIFFGDEFGFSLGVFYLLKENGIDMCAHYGFTDRRERQSKLKPDEGLIGESIKYQKIITMDNPPPDYIKVSSGLGSATPKCIMILPLIVKDSVIGVIEFCSLNDIKISDKTIIENLSKNLAIHFKMLLDRQELALLFEKTDQQKQYLQQQEEELKSTNEELESQSNALKQSEEELRSTNDELKEQVELIQMQKNELKNTTEKLKKASQYKSEFLANMSHELRTPLNSLLILAQSFMKNKLGNLTEEQEKEAEIIYEAGSDLLVLINDILDISKVESGKMTIEVSEIDICDIIKTIKNQFNPLAKKKNIKLNIDVSDETPLTIKSDQLRLLQILKNLVSNAIKFTKKGAVSISISIAHNNIYFSVSDTGIGIPKDKHELIFASFQQADGSTSRQYGGTGLGLSISKKLSELMGGKLSLESDIGKGSTFTLTLPLASHEDLTSRTKEKHGSSNFTHQTNGNKVLAKLPGNVTDDRDLLPSEQPVFLIIDDDIVFAQSISKIIHENNNLALIAVDGETGLQLAKTYQPQGILLDLGLPDISGEAVFDTLKSDENMKDIPVHIISAQDRSHDLIKRGALSFLQKPIKREDIFHLLGNTSETHINHILIVEDDQVAQKGLREIFETINNNVQLDFVNSAVDAKKAIMNHHYCCLIIDLGLPDESGISLIESMVDEMRTIIPIIVYTARELTPEEFRKINQYTDKIIIKGLEATERLLDEVELFLHHIEKHPSHQLASTSHKKDEIRQSQHFNGEHVLLVDDDLRNTFALSRTLESEGLEIVIADNGQLAIEKLESYSSFDLILMDMMMPVMDGYEAIKNIRANDKFKHIPIIAVTAKASNQDKGKCMDIGASDYMSKPINVDSLISLLSKYLKHDNREDLA